MKIRKIIFENHPFFGNLEVDFTDKSGNTIDTIIIAGENGVGKSILLNTIYEFSNLGMSNEQRNEKRFFEIQLTEDEIEVLRIGQHSKQFFSEVNYDENILFIEINYNIVDSWAQVQIKGKIDNILSQDFGGHLFIHDNTRLILKTIFSDVEINFNTNPIHSVTSSNIDRTDLFNQRSNPNLATEITQLLIDIQSLDSLEFSEWARENIGKPVEKTQMDVRMNRFTSAFEFMFPTKKYKNISNSNNQKQIIFEENGKEMSINQLSSGEKQIVFRGSFLLKDKDSSKGALILIDEPETSLHPTWQMKILSFFKKLFIDNDGKQTSQLIITTHSPFIIHNDNRSNDKVIVLKKNENGLISISDESKFYSWDTETIIQEAFNISNTITEGKTTIFVEGETDEKYFNKCLEIFKKTHLPIQFKWIGKINSKGNVEFTGSSALNHTRNFFNANPELVREKIVLLYDCDVNKPVEINANLLVKTMELNTENTLYRKGIENLLTLTQDIQTDLFYKENHKTDEYGGFITKSELDKTKLCDFICETLDDETNEIVLNKINKEIDLLMDLLDRQ